MRTRKELKEEAKKNVKTHIIIYIIICAIAAFIGAEFKGTLFATEANENNTFSAIATSLIEEGFDKTKEKIDNTIKEYQNNESKVLGRTNGVFAVTINAISTGSFFMVGVSAIKNIVGSPTVGISIGIGISVILYFLYWFYIVNIYNVLSRRMFMEGRTYRKVPFRRIFYLSSTKCWNKVSKAMFFKELYEFFWALTIIGGIIKHYSYLMVPYILAENPNMNSKQAITLSRKMMDGHKWEAFKLDLSFIGWNILGMFTWGILNLVFTNPYQVATFSEFYNELRKESIEKNIENSNLLNDTFLYEKADEELINKEYEDVIEIINQEDYKFEKKKGIQYRLKEFFGIHNYTEEEKQYEKQQMKEFVKDEYSEVISKDEYPFRLFTIEHKEKKKRIQKLNYLRRYSLISIIYIFFIISFIGWLWEVMLYLINEGIFVNRGTMHGPWLPIYGGGSVLILLGLSKFRKKPLTQFILAVILCGILEYFTAWILETMHNGQKWWDYSGYFINLHGRICAEGLLTFGFGGLAMVYFIAPAIDNFLRDKGKKILTIVAILLITLFSFDAIFSGKNPNTGRGINDYEVIKEDM